MRGWVHAYRLNAEQANRARHKCRQGHKKGTPTAESLWLAGWVLVFTTLAPAGLSPQTIMALYQWRWQVEIAIKRWKSVLDVDALRAKAHRPLAEVWLHGKLLYALMLERRMRRQLGDRWGQLDQERVGTWWRVWGMLKDEIAPRITGALLWKADAWAACLKSVNGTASPEESLTTTASRSARHTLSLQCKTNKRVSQWQHNGRYSPGELMLILAQMPDTLPGHWGTCQARAPACAWRGAHHLSIGAITPSSETAMATASSGTASWWRKDGFKVWTLPLPAHTQGFRQPIERAFRWRHVPQQGKEFLAFLRSQMGHHPGRLLRRQRGPGAFVIPARSSSGHTACSSCGCPYKLRSTRTGPTALV